MQANSNATTSARWPKPLDHAEPAVAGHWRAAFVGAWLADWRERWRDWRVWLVLGLGAALAATAAGLTALELQDRLTARQAAQQSEQQRWLNQGKKYPHSAAHYGVYAFKPLSPLAAVDPGVERYVGSGVWLEAHKQNEFVYRPANDEPGASRQVQLTPAFVLQVLAPLALVFLGFASFAGERERGMLATLRISAAPMTAVASARSAVLWCLGLLIALPAGAAAALVQWRLDAASPFTDTAVRVLVFGGGYALYLAFWALLVVAVSALAGTLLRSLAVGIGLWAALTLVMPRAAVEAAQAAAPLPSVQAFRQAMEQALGEPHDPVEEARQKAAILEQHGVSDVKQLPINWAGLSLQRGEERGDAIFDAHYGRVYAAMAAQSRAIGLWSWLSPTVAVAGLSAAAAGSDTAHHVQFIDGAEAQRRRIQVLMNGFITANPERDGQRVDADGALWAQVPAFNFVFAPLVRSGALASNLLPLGVLFSLCAVLCAYAARRLGREALT